MIRVVIGAVAATTAVLLLSACNQHDGIPLKPQDAFKCFGSPSTDVLKSKLYAQGGQVSANGMNETSVSVDAPLGSSEMQIDQFKLYCEVPVPSSQLPAIFCNNWGGDTNNCGPTNWVSNVRYDRTVRPGYIRFSAIIKNTGTVGATSRLDILSPKIPWWEVLKARISPFSGK